MAQAEKSGTHAPATTQNGGTNLVNLGPRDSLHGRLEIQGDLKVAGKVEGEPKGTGDGSGGNPANVQAPIEGSNTSGRGPGNANAHATRRLTLCGSRRLNADGQGTSAPG